MKSDILLSPTSKIILTILENHNKKYDLLQLYNSKIVISLFTINLFPKEIENQLIVAEYKEIKVLSEALLELSKSTKEKKVPAIYSYPYLLESSSQEIIIRIVVISLLNHTINDCKKIIHSLKETCFKISLPVMSSFLYQAINFDLNSNPYDIYRLSIYKKIQNVLMESFLPYQYIPQDDFIEKCIQYGIEKNILIKICDNYFISKRNYSKKHLKLHMEEVFKSLKNFLLEKIYRLETIDKKTKEILLNYKDNYAEKSLFTSEEQYSKELLDIIFEAIDSLKQDISSLKLSKKQQNFTLKILNDASNIIQSLCSFFSKSVQDDKNDFNVIFNQLIERTNEHTKNDLDFLEIDLEEMCYEYESNDADKLAEIKKELINNLSSNKNIIFKKVPNKDFYIILDCGYLSAVVKNLENKILQDENSETYQFKLNVINSNRKNLDKLEYTNSKITREIFKKIENELLAIKKDISKKSNNMGGGNFNLAVCVYSLVALNFLFGLVTLSLNKPFLFAVGFLLSCIISISLGFFFKKKNKKETVKEIGKSKTENSFSSNSDKSKKQNSKSKLTKKMKVEMNKVLFEKDFKRVDDKIYDADSLREKIEANLEKTKKKLEQELTEEEIVDNSALIASLEHAALQNIARINIPPRSKNFWKTKRSFNLPSRFKI